MKRLKGFMFLGAGLIFAVLAGLVGFVTVLKATAQGSGAQASEAKAAVVVAARTIPVRSTVSADDLLVMDVSAEAIPEGAIRTVADAAGKVAVADLYPGEIILSERLLDPDVITADGRMALVLAGDKVLMAFPTKDLMSRIDVLKPGDHVDLLFSFEFPTSSGSDGEGAAGTSPNEARPRKDLSTFALLQNVTISGVVGGTVPAKDGKSTKIQPPDALLLTLSPQDALILKYMRDAGGVADVVLRSPGVDRPFSTDPVDVEYVMNRYRIVKDMEP